MTLQEGLEIIGERCFADFHGNGVPIREIVIPKSVKTIGESAFYNCYNLTSATIPKNAKIGEYIFP